MFRLMSLPRARGPTARAAEGAGAAVAPATQPRAAVGGRGFGSARTSGGRFLVPRARCLGRRGVPSRDRAAKGKGGDCRAGTSASVVAVSEILESEHFRQLSRVNVMFFAGSERGQLSASGWLSI